MANIALITNNVLSDSGTAITSLVSGSGTANYLSKFTGSTALGNSLIYDDGTFVGIGTATPSYKLDVNGTGRFTGTTNQITAYYDASNYLQLQHNSISVANTALLFNVNSAERMRLLSTGNLLIGTTTDSGHKLQVNGTAIFYGSPTISVSNLPQLTLNDTLQSHNWVIRSNGTSLFFIDNGNNRVWIGGTGSGNAGNVGIGTTSTSYKLDVNGTARVVTSLRVGADGNTYTSIDNGSFNISRISDGGNGIVSIQGPTVLNANRSIGRFNGREGVQLSYDTAGRLQVFQTTTTIGLGANDTSLTNDTSTILRLDGSKTASSAIARGANFVPTLVAAANSDVLVGFDITPTFTNGAFTGVVNYGIRTSGDIAFASSANRYLTMQSPSTSGNGGNIIIQSAAANTSGTGGNLYLYVGGGAGGPGPGKIYIGNNNGWDVAYVTGILTVSSTGPNTGDVLRVSGGGRNALTISWDNVTPFMSYSLVSGRQSRFLNSSSYYFDNNFLIGTTTNSGYKLDVNGTARIVSDLYLTVGLSATTSGNVRFEPSTNYFTNNRISSSGLSGFQISTSSILQSFWRYNNASGNTEIGSTSYGIQFFASNSVQAFLTSGGNFLIGTTTDNGNKLQVTGSATVSGNISTLQHKGL